MTSTGGGQDDLLDDLMDIMQASNDSKNQEDNYLNDDGLNEINFNEMNPNDSFDNDEDSFDSNPTVDNDNDAKSRGENNSNQQLNYYVYDKMQIKSMYLKAFSDTILPEGWVQVTHACGMPLYLNRQTRVCTLSKPYYIGQSSARKHEIPLSSIPCMAYKKRKEDIENQMKEHQKRPKQAATCPFSQNENQQQQQQQQPEGEQKANSKVVVSIQTSEEKMKENLMAPEKVNEYCKKLFDFDIVKVKKFKTWNDRKKFIRNTKQKKIPENSKMLKIQTKTNKGINKEFSINMTNKTPLCILYEYANQVHKVSPRFEIEEKENPKDPFLAVCYINNDVCGRGTGNSKKTAKNNAAEAALCVLIPDFKNQLNSQQKNNDQIYSFFDEYNVEHSYIYTLSQQLGAPLPYEILLTCLKFNYAINISRNTKEYIQEDIKPIKFRNCLYRMKLANYDVEVNCSKKKEGRQLASQKILKLMHPHIQTWGSMLRLYGPKMVESYLKQSNDDKSDQENNNTNNTNNNNGDTVKSEEDAKSVGVADNKKAIIGKSKPNMELLDKLKQEMRKLIKKNETEIRSELMDEEETKKKENGDSLTLPPLLLVNDDLISSSSNFLMKPESLRAESDSSLKDTIPLSSFANDTPSTSSLLSNNLRNEETTNSQQRKSKRKKLDEKESDDSSTSDSNDTTIDSDDDDDSEFSD